MRTSHRPISEQVRVLVLNEGENKSEELYRLKKGLNLI
jgi:hypothetical protein